jgi:Beta-lactamase/WG containing repeat
MTKLPLGFCLFLILLLSAAPLPYQAKGQTKPTYRDKTPSDFASQAREYMNARARVTGFSGAVLVARNGRAVFRRSYGLANHEFGIPNTPTIKFRLASAGKQFTAAAILLLEQRGKLKVTDPEFDKATDFSEGRALVGFDQSKKEMRRENKTYVTGSSHPSYIWGYIDRTGKYVAAPIYPHALGFSEGLAAVQLSDGQWGYIDKAGSLVIKPQFQSASSFSEGLSCVMFDKKYGFIDRTGKMVIPPQFTGPGVFAEGLAPVRVGGKVLDPGFGMVIGPLGGRYVYIDKAGKEVITLGDNVENTNPFSEGLAAVEIKGYWGFIDKKGKIVIEPRFGGQPSFSEGLACVIIRDGGGIGFIDKTGTIALKLNFALAENFRDGLAFVYDSLDVSSSKYGYIDKAGKVIWPPSK